MATSTEIAERGPTTIAERAEEPRDLRRVLELRALLQAQDDAMILDAYRGGYVDRVQQSVRIVATGQVDPDEKVPVFASVGAAQTPDEVLAEMTGKPFLVHHRPVTGPIIPAGVRGL